MPAELALHQELGPEISRRLRRRPFTAIGLSANNPQSSFPGNILPSAPLNPDPWSGAPSPGGRGTGEGEQTVRSSEFRLPIRTRDPKGSLGFCPSQPAPQSDHDRSCCLDKKIPDPRRKGPGQTGERSIYNIYTYSDRVNPFLYPSYPVGLVSAARPWHRRPGTAGPGGCRAWRLFRIQIGPRAGIPDLFSVFGVLGKSKGPPAGGRDAITPGSGMRWVQEFRRPAAPGSSEDKRQDLPLSAL